VITIFPRLFDMNNTSYQVDWLGSMDISKLKDDTTSETAGCIIFFMYQKDMRRNGKRSSKNMTLWNGLN
tara:strand:- start:164742 stop:164948 length:207 start_codon:yes stop_codon:yes gene_type:complete